VIDELDRRWPGLRDRLCEAGPRIREHINVFVDGDRVELSSPVGPDAVVHVIPAVSGGGGRP
jgi:molybdopterin converting factor small subunit